jgi:hypothetical protein
MKVPNKISASAAAIFAVYALAASGALVWGIATHTPCVSDFEGGCGYGKMWAGLFSWLAAVAATGAAAAMAGLSASLPAARRYFIGAGIVLGAPPLAYAMYGLYSITSWVIGSGLLSS